MMHCKRKNPEKSFVNKINEIPFPCSQKRFDFNSLSVHCIKICDFYTAMCYNSEHLIIMFSVRVSMQDILIQFVNKLVYAFKIVADFNEVFLLHTNNRKLKFDLFLIAVSNP